MKKVVLASQSPRRKQLLEWADISFDVLVSQAEEDFPSEMEVEQVPVFIARNKAYAVRSSEKYSRYEEGSVIIAADTIVVLNGEVIGKPFDRQEAIDILSKLSGNIHRVITGVVILDGNKEESFYDITEVSFWPLTKDQIEYYVDHYHPYDKAGAYAIQEWIGVCGIEWIRGDFYNVMGLPVSRVVKILGEKG
jgi:septum formation protein